MTRVFVGTEKELLLAFLDQQRDVVVWKLDELTDGQLRQRPLTPSGLYLLGLVKHLAGVEQYWLCQLFVDLLSFLAFCMDAANCVPERVQEVTTAKLYRAAPGWLREGYPELFEHPHLRERIMFYGIARWAQDIHRSEPAVRKLALRKLAEIVDREGPASLLE